MSTPLSRAEQAVTEARDDLIGFALVALPNEPGFAGAEHRTDALVAAVREQVACEIEATIRTWEGMSALVEARNETLAKAARIARAGTKESP